MAGNWRKAVIEYALITAGCLLYAFATVFFIFPDRLLIGGVSGLSVILNEFLPFSPGTILAILEVVLLIAAAIFLGKEMATKSFYGSIATTVFIWGLEYLFPLETAPIPNVYLSVFIGAAIIALSSGMLFYVDASSGGTDIIALIVQKYTKVKDIGKALLVTDVLIVVIGGVLSGLTLAIASCIGLIVKTLGIDVVTKQIKRLAGNDGEKAETGNKEK